MTPPSIAPGDAQPPAQSHRRMKRVIVLVGPDGKPDRSPEPPPKERNPLYWPHGPPGQRATCREAWVKRGGTCAVCKRKRPDNDLALHPKKVPPETSPHVGREEVAAIRVLLDTEPTVTWTIVQIARHFGWDREYAVRAMSTAYGEGEAARVAYGLYRSTQDPDGYLKQFQVRQKSRRRRQSNPP